MVSSIVAFGLGKDVGQGCDLVPIELDLVNTRFLMNKKLHDQRKIDPVSRCAGSDHRGLCKHRAEDLSYRKALSVEGKYRNNGLLDRRAAQPK